MSNKDKVGGKMIRTKKVWAFFIGLGILLVLAGGGFAYLVYSGRINLKADSATTVISNTVYGTYTSEQGSGNVTSNEVQVQVSNTTP